MTSGRSLQEMRRQNAVVLYGLADPERGTVDTDDLDAITGTLRQFLGVEYTAVHILDGDLVVTLAAAGGDSHAAPMRREESICGVVLDGVGDAQLIEVPDAAHEPSLQSVPAVGAEGAVVRFYAAAMLRTDQGLAIGTLCAVGSTPRTLDVAERDLLLHLGYAAIHVLDRHRRRPRAADPA